MTGRVFAEDKTAAGHLVTTTLRESPKPPVDAYRVQPTIRTLISAEPVPKTSRGWIRSSVNGLLLSSLAFDAFK